MKYKNCDENKQNLYSESANRTNVLRKSDSNVSRETILHKGNDKKAKTNVMSEKRRLRQSQKQNERKQELDRIRRRGGLDKIYDVQSLNDGESEKAAAVTTAAQASENIGQQEQRHEQSAQQTEKQTEKQSEKLPNNISSPSYSEMYTRFRSNGLSKIESAFNSAYLYCNDKYYSSDAAVKTKYRNIYAHPGMWYRHASSLWRHNKWSVAVAVLDTVPKLQRASHLCQEKFVQAKATVKSIWRHFEYSHIAVRSIGKFVGNVLVYGASFGFLVFSGMLIANKLTLRPALGLYVDGEYVGAVNSVSEVESTKSVFDETMSLNLGKSFRLDSSIKYVPTLAENGSKLNQKGIYAAFENTAKSDMLQGYGLYVDGALAGVSPYKAWIDSAVEESLEIKKAELKKAGIDVDNVTYYNNVTVNAGTFPKSVFLSLAEVRKIFGLEPITQSDYEILKDGSIDYAPKPFNFTTSASNDGVGTTQPQPSAAINYKLYNENNSVPDFITDLENNSQPSVAASSIQATSLDVIVEHVETVTEEIQFDTVYESDPELVEGKQKTVSTGKAGLREVVYNVSFVDGKEIKRTAVSEKVLTEPTSAVIKVGARPMTEEEKRVASKGYFIWPHSNERVSSGYGWRLMGSSNEFHKGIDICGDLGSDIVASDGGEVIFAAYDKSGYGECVLIRHDDGSVTRYAHCSKLYVEKGQKVAQGEVIAAMGKTGSATGVHVHFEIIVDGIIKNPYDYLPEE